MDNLKKTSLFPSYKKHGAKLVDYAGWSMPVEFSGLTREHEAVRTAAGLFDVSHMGEIEVKGKEATEYLQYLLTNNIGIMHDNQIIYAFMCYENGGVVDDLLVYKYSAGHYLLVVNAANMEKDYQWMLDQKGDYQVEIDNLSDQFSEVALQGPKAEAILQRLTDTDLSKVPSFYLKRDVKIAGANCLLSRTGYTGEDGFEIYLGHEDAPLVWEKILEVGKADGVVPVGLGARDTLRFEAALPLYGNEISQDISPLEAGLGYFVKFDKGDFIGREALFAQKQEGPARKLIGFEMTERGIPRHGYPVLSEGKEIGFVTTGYYSPTLGKSIGFALVQKEYANLGDTVEIQIRKKTAKAKIVDKRFYAKNYKK
ncbi:MAG: glycine cleavage system aminomethyltransferase GcvT [Clostridia bacterium]|jgi:aminomethyltransferase|nr:glycine cleavage system aminomethyltransferase GcvT [Clostridiales bacterium]